eukprot:TRINITY_DN3205_c0_g2_i4.p2 TRINITY_DN3205_c0_g2~~TRINITY_DN3205_c0_g2_i4.p2  ORF type:complete len:171 (-),score=91.20 TRINITY_DN3205_c0_g2_i4:81-533(-)
MARAGVTVKDVPADAFIGALAEHFKKSGKIELPVWHNLVKTASFKELPPIDPDWMFVRAASLARKVYLNPGLGVGAYSSIYGGSARRGVRRPRHGEAATGVIRYLLKQLESNGLVEQAAKGRKITKEGQRELDTIAGQVASKGLASVWKY